MASIVSKATGFLALILCIVPAGPSWAGCPVQLTSLQLEERIDAATTELEKLNIDAFRTQTDAIQGVLECVSEPVSASIIAKLHRVNAMRAFGERASLVAEMFAAARRLEPDYSLPPSIAQKGNPLNDAYIQIDIGQRETMQIRKPTSGSVVLDGEVTLDRAAEWPAFAQVFDAEDAVVATAYVLPDEPLPVYPGSSGVIGKQLRTPLLATAATSGVASAVLYGLAAGRAARYHNLEDRVPNEELEALRQRINTGVAASIATGTLAASAGVALVVVW